MGPIAKLYAEISGDTRKLDSSLKSSEKKLSTFGKTLQSIGPLIGAAFGVVSINAIARTTFEMAKLGAESKRLRASYEGLTRVAGLSGDALLSSMKKASMGSISEIDLILSANRALRFGLVKTNEDFTKLIQVATFYGRQMGVSAKDSIDRIVTGLGRGSTQILDDLGIIGLTFSQTESKASMAAKVISKGMEDIAAAGGLVGDELTNFEKLDAKLADINEKWATLTTGPTVAVLDLTITGIEGWERAAAALATIQAITGGGGGIQAPTVAGIQLPEFDPLLIPKLIGLGPGGLAVMEIYKGIKFGLEHGAEDAAANVTTDVIQMVAGPQVAQAMETGLITPLGTLQDKFDSFIHLWNTAEPGTLWFESIKSNLEKLDVLIKLYGPDKMFAGFEKYDWADIWGNFDDTATRAMRNTAWEMMTVEQRTDAITQAAQEAADAIRKMGSGPVYTPQFQVGAWQPAYANYLRTVEAQKNKKGSAKIGVGGPLLSSMLSASGDDFIRAQLGGGDAWDEQARRMKDVEMRGKASPWAKAFEIPADIWDEGGEKLKAYAQQWQQDFYAGLKPEEANAQALVDQYKEQLQGEFGKQQILADALALAQQDPEIISMANQLGIDLTQGINTGLVMENGALPLQPLKDDLTIAEGQITTFKELWENLDDKNLTLLIEMIKSDSSSNSSTPTTTTTTTTTTSKPDTGGVIGLQTGGIVGGFNGNPVPILAHMGEMVLNRQQQLQTASLISGGGGGNTVIVSAGVFMGNEAEAQKFGRKILPYIERARGPRRG